MRNSIDDNEKLGNKISDEDKETIRGAVEEALAWLMEHPEETKEAYSDKVKEIEGVCNPIISKVYQGAGGGEEYAHDEL